jgi:poly-beta-1,6-N-acetyl-D-glucosamine synthase
MTAVAPTPLRGESVQRGEQLTVIVPAYNEADSIADTIRSLQRQTSRVGRIVVVDDCSTDATGQVAAALGVTVVTTPVNSGSKAGAQTFALAHVTTEFVMAVDADTVLAPDAVEQLLHAFDDPRTAAACGFVLPRHVRTMWERGRYVEYLFAFNFFKQIQDYYGKPLIASGCFAAYRTQAVRRAGGWSTRTMAEDMDLTWTFYEAGQGVRFIPEAVCYPIEPHDFTFMRKQLRRWMHGLVQNLRVHWRGALQVPYLRSVLALGLWDAVFASVGYLLVLPLLALLVSPWFLLGYLIDLPIIIAPLVAGAARSRRRWQALASIPAFLVLRVVNSVFVLRALWMELVMHRTLRTYEKGH